MKKLTLLVVGLAMGVASVFAEDVSWDNYNTPIGGSVYAYAGYASVSSINNANKLTITYSGDIYQIRLETAEGASGGTCWFNPAQSSHFATVDGNDIVREGNNTTISINLIPAGFAGVTAFHVHSGDAEATGTCTISAMALEYDSNLTGSVEPKWKSKDGSVEVYGINAEGYVHEDIDNFPNPIHWYDTYANDWVKDYPAVNQNFTFAIEAREDAEGKESEADDDKAFLDYTGAGEAIPTYGIHTWDVNGENADKQTGDFRLERISGYVYGVDMNASAMKGEQGGLFQLGECGAKPELAEFWFNVTLAFIGEETEAGEVKAWWEATSGTHNLNFKAALPVAQEIEFDADWAATMGVTLTGGVASIGTATGIDEVIADAANSEKAQKVVVDGQTVIVKGNKVYSILGAEIK